MSHMTLKCEPMPAYNCPFPNFGDPQFGICNWMWGGYADRFVDVNVPEEVRRILGDSSAAAVLTTKFFDFVRTGYSDLVGTEDFTSDLHRGGWNEVLQNPPKKKEPISSLDADRLSTGHGEMSTSNSGMDSLGSCWCLECVANCDLFRRTSERAVYPTLLRYGTGLLESRTVQASEKS